MRYGVYFVEVDHEPYNHCCFFLASLIYMSYFESGHLYKRLECSACISDDINFCEVVCKCGN